LHLTHSCDSPGKLRAGSLEELRAAFVLGCQCGLGYDVAVGFRARSHSKSLLRVWHHRTEGSAATLWVVVVKYSSAFGLSSSLFTDLFTRMFLYFCLVIRFYGLGYAVQK
jgi:hypothetical protein